MGLQYGPGGGSGCAPAWDAGGVRGASGAGGPDPGAEQLRCLLAVAECGDPARAAVELRISQHALGQQIGRLERTVGATLLEARGSGFRLTDAGEACVREARCARYGAAGADAVSRRVRGARLRLATTPEFSAYLIGPLLAALYGRHPEITVAVHELPEQDMAAALLAGEADVGVAHAGAGAPGVAERYLFTETLSLVVASGEDRPGRRVPTWPIPVRSLTGRQLALLDGDFATRDCIDGYFAAHGVTPRIVLEADSISVLTDLVRSTPALATVLPDAVTDDHPQLRPVPVDPPLPSRRAALLVREGAVPGPATESLVRLAGQVVRERGYAGA